MKIVPIIFSKNRPMQLRAHLESMRAYTGFYDQINVITPTPDIYKDVCHDFWNVNLIDEKTQGGFHVALTGLVNSLVENDVVLFSVDDFIYANYFNLHNGLILNNSPLSSVIGFTLRMGKNTVPYNDQWNVCDTPPFIIYDWRGKPSHLGYPFDVSCSMYRVSVVKEIFNLMKRPMNIPNDTEAFGVTAVMNELSGKYPHYMMHNGNAIGACADINRVQDLYQNRTQGGEQLTAENMIKMYQEGKRIDWMRYYNIAPPEPFVGKEGMVIG